MERILKEQGRSLDSAVLDMLDTLYGKTVPLRERKEIEAKIQQQEAQAAAEKEASRRFGIYHIREQGGDSYFYSEVHAGQRAGSGSNLCNFQNQSEAAEVLLQKRSN